MSDAEWDSSTRDRGSNRLTIHDVAFKVKDVSLECIQLLIEIAAKAGVTRWRDVEHYYRTGVHPEHIIWFEPDIGINGNDGGYAQGRQTVSYDVFLRLYKEYYEKEMKKVTLENAVFKYSEVGEKEYQALIDVAERHMDINWENAAQYMRHTSRPNEHVTWFDEQEGFDGADGGPSDDQVIVPFEVFFKLYCEHFGEVIKPVGNPRPRYRKRRVKQQKVAKTFVRVLYTTQQVYTFKNVKNVQVIDGNVYIQHEREVVEGISEYVETKIDETLVMAVVIQEVGNRSSFLRNIDGSWTFQAEDGTLINGGTQLGRVFK